MQVLTRTPIWVWALLLGLVALGLYQRRDRVASATAVVAVPLAMLALSLQAIRTTFGAQPGAATAWLAGLLLAQIVGWAAGAPRGASYDPAARRFALPGSSVPLALMLGIFGVRYALGALTAARPQALASPSVGLAAGLLLGVLSGTFVARASRLVWIAARTPAIPRQPTGP